MDHEFTELHCANCNKHIGYVNLKLLGINPMEVNYIMSVEYRKQNIVVNCFCSEECARVYDYSLEKSNDKDIDSRM